jgi:hypothetical protein
LIIVNGPYAKKIGINSTFGVFGRGYRANGTIGRAIRLILWNLGSNFPGEVDRSLLSSPGSWSFCIAEDEEGNPWEPFHVTRGMPSGTSTVTAFACDCPIITHSYGSAGQILRSITRAMASPASANYLFLQPTSEILVTLSSLNAEQIHSEGWTKSDIQHYIWEHARCKVSDILDSGMLEAPHTGGTDSGTIKWPKWIDRSNPDALVPPTSRPEDIHIIVCGGRGTQSSVCPGWGGGGIAVTKEIHVPESFGASKADHHGTMI